jgi:ubiquinone/menaquinone biosynthesis C-methylase UbiE
MHNSQISQDIYTIDKSTESSDHATVATDSSINTNQYLPNDILSWGQNTYKRHLDSVKSTIYNTTIGYFYTSDIMRNILVEIPNNSKILDVGIGTGYAYLQNSDLIKRKNIHITGIDIDSGNIRTAKHNMIDSDLESYTTLVNGDVYKMDENQIMNNSFDFLFFLDSYSVIPNIHTMITFCEKYLNSTGIIIVASTLFDRYDENLDWIKQRLIYISSIEFGNMMLKTNLEEYIKTRYSGDIDQCFRIINSTSILGITCDMKTYIVKWCPDCRTKDDGMKLDTLIRSI